MKSSVTLSSLLAFATIAVAQDDARPLVDSASLLSGIQSDSLLAHAQKISDIAKSNGGERPSGSTGYNATIAYVKEQLEKTGYYDIEEVITPFTFKFGNSTLTVSGKNTDVVWVEFAPAADLTAAVGLAKGDGCNATDYEGLAGKFALTPRRGGCLHRVKNGHAADAKAAGLIIYNTVPEQIPGCSLGESALQRPGFYLPTACISGADGDSIVSALGSGTEVVAHLQVAAFYEARGAINLIATTKSGEHNNIIISGAETESALGSPGLNFYGATTASNLDIALQLSKYSVKNAVRFAFWSLTNIGSIGATNYFNRTSTEERKKFALYLEADVLASSNGGYFVIDGYAPGTNATSPSGTDKIAKVYNDFYASAGIPTQPRHYSTSQFEEVFAFVNGSIPAGGITTNGEGNKTAEQAALWGGVAGAEFDPCVSLPCDDVPHLNVTSWVINTKAIANAIATFATSLDGIPSRT